MNRVRKAPASNLSPPPPAPVRVPISSLLRAPSFLRRQESKRSPSFLRAPSFLRRQESKRSTPLKAPPSREEIDLKVSPHPGGRFRGGFAATPPTPRPPAAHSPPHHSHRRKNDGREGAPKHALALLVVLAALGAALTAIAPTAAHAAYAASTPAFGEVLDAAPAQIELRFTQQLFRREGANTIRLERSADGAEIPLSPVAIDNADRSAMRADLPPRQAPLPPGRYLVSWQNLSADDGDTDSGSYPFYIGQGPNAEDEAADRALAAALLIPYPGDEPDSAATESETEQRPPTVIRREAEPTGGIAASSIVWLALGAAALLTIAATSLRRRRAS